MQRMASTLPPEGRAADGPRPNPPETGAGGGMTGLAGGAGWLKREPPLLPDPKLPPDLATGAWNPDAAAPCRTNSPLR